MVKKGPYGWYVEHEDVRTSLAPLFTPETITLEKAMWLLSLPHELGMHPETGLPIVMGLGRFGPYVKYQQRFYSIKKYAPETLSLDQALDIIRHAPPPKTAPGAPTPSREKPAAPSATKLKAVKSTPSDTVEKASTTRAKKASPATTKTTKKTTKKGPDA
jgi:hypothetical protein